MQNVSVGQNLMTLVSLDDIWITANFKETQLRSMRPGQEVKIHVDAYGRDYDGKVTQIGGATGRCLACFRRRMLPGIMSRWCSGFRCGLI